MYGVGVSRRKSRVVQTAIVAAIALIAAACTGSDQATIQTTTTSTSASVTSSTVGLSAQPVELCVLGPEVMAQQATASLNQFSPQYFASVDADFESLMTVAPDELQSSLTDLRDGFATTASIYADFGFNAGAEGFIDALTEGLDNDAMIDAADAIGLYLGENCSPGGYSFDRSDPVNGPLNVQALSPDMSDETAQCIYDAWGDISSIPPEELTPELYVFPICGTSLFELLTGDDRFADVETPDS